jgi:hypothetical protein
MSRAPIVVEDSKIPKALSLVIDIWGITLWPFVLVRGKIDPFTLRHETIHIRQQAELLVLPFYVLYLGFWLYRWWQLGDRKAAYYAIPFEREAYAMQDNPSYLTFRRPHAWRHYIRLDGGMPIT